MSVASAFRAAGVSASVAQHEASLAEAAMRERGITTQARSRDFLAQVLHESGGLRYFEEIADGSAYEGRCRDLGNCRPGDGRRYKGRGPIQLTGRANYRTYGRALGLPLEAQPRLASQHRIGWRIAALYWQSRGLNQLADRGDFRAITLRINGGLNGWDDRVRYRRRLWGSDCRPGSDRFRYMTATERRWCEELVRLRRENRDRDRRSVLYRRLVAQRKRIWRAAQGPGGWERAHRRERYRILAGLTR